MNDNLVSIIMPVYNGEKYLKEALESCINQSYKNIEIIIVNDCSTDNSLFIMESFLKIDSRIKIINNSVNKKLPACLNIGHENSRGDYISWTSHDNYYNENAIETLIKPLINENYDISYSDFILVDNESIYKKEILLQESGALIFGNCIGASFMYKKDVYTRNIKYDENLFLVEDYDFWLRAFTHSRFIHINEKLYYYRTHGESLSAKIKENLSKKKMWKNNLYLMYSNFITIYNIKNNNIATILTNNLTDFSVDFDLIKKENENIKIFRKKLKLNINFQNDKELDRLFLRTTLNIVFKNENSKISNTIFIIKNYYNLIKINNLKTLIKYLMWN